MQPTITEPRRRPLWKRWQTWVVAGVLAVLVGLVGGPFVYIHFIKEDAPTRLTFEDATTSTRAASATTTSGASVTAAPSSTAASGATVTTTPSAAAAPGGGGALDGTWAVTPQRSQVGYRVKEVLFGQSTEAVGRTGDVTGQVAIQGTTVSSGSFTVDMTTVTSPESRRDSQFNGRIMNTSSFPTATLTLTQPIDLGEVPADLAEITRKANADLTLRGVTKPVTFDVKARRNAGAIEVNGSIPITFADWNIPNPTTAGITTEDHGELEFLLVLGRS
jgi:polyisoprenoid-binding protein YceI